MFMLQNATEQVRYSAEELQEKGIDVVGDEGAQARDDMLCLACSSRSELLSSHPERRWFGLCPSLFHLPREA
jgi:hypothetical protein